MLGASAMVCSRMLFLFINDPEGPNLLIVSVMALILYVLSFVAYQYTPIHIKGLSRLLLSICIQILLAVGLYFCMR